MRNCTYVYAKYIFEVRVITRKLMFYLENIEQIVEASFYNKCIIKIDVCIYISICEIFQLFRLIGFFNIGLDHSLTIKTAEAMYWIVCALWVLAIT